MEQHFMGCTQSKQKTLLIWCFFFHSTYSLRHCWVKSFNVRNRPWKFHSQSNYYMLDQLWFCGTKGTRRITKKKSSRISYGKIDEIPFLFFVDIVVTNLTRVKIYCYIHTHSYACLIIYQPDVLRFRCIVYSVL